MNLPTKCFMSIKPALDIAKILSEQNKDQELFVTQLYGNYYVTQLVFDDELLIAKFVNGLEIKDK